jgi:hypothetical protein
MSRVTRPDWSPKLRIINITLWPDVLAPQNILISENSSIFGYVYKNEKFSINKIMINICFRDTYISFQSIEVLFSTHGIIIIIIIIMAYAVE